MKYEIQQTNDLNRLNFDTAISIPIFYGNEPTKTDKYVGVYNVDKEKLTQVATDRYAIIQHNEVMGAVVDVLTKNNLSVSGRVDDFGDKIRADLIFMNQTKPITDDASGVKIGMRVLNSYNKQTSFRLEMFGFRTVCQNGMSLGNVMNNIKEVTFHTGKLQTLDNIRLTTERFIRRVISSSDELQKLINESIYDNIYYKDAMFILEKLLKQKKHRKEICNRFDISIVEVYDKITKHREYKYYCPENNINRWDLYNALTEYATHSDISDNVEYNIQNVAQKVLKNNFEKLLVVANY